MIDSLNQGSIQKLQATLSAGRIESLLRIGIPQTARVVEVTPQAAPTGTTTVRPVPPAQQTQQTQQSRQAQQTQGPSQTAPSQPGGQPQPARQGAATPATSPQAGARAPAPASGQAPTNASRMTASGAEGSGYRAKLEVQGRLLEVITPRPLTPGTEVQLNRDSSNRISIQLPAASAQRQPQAGQSSSPQATAASGSQRVATDTPRLPIQPGQTLTASVIRSATTPETASVATPQPPRAQAGTAAPPPPVPRGAPLTDGRTTPAASPSPSGPQGSASVSPNTTPAPGRPQAPAAAAAQPLQYRATLNLQGQTLDILTPQRLPPGTQVQVSQDAAGRVSVHVPAQQSQAVENALRQHLPQQQPPHQLLNLLAEPQSMVQLSRSEPLLQGLVQLLLGRSMATPQKTDASSVQQQLQNSGTLFENRLARGDSGALQTDQKALLLKLEQNLTSGNASRLPQPLGQRITEMTQQAISRVLYNQLSSLGQGPQDPSGEPLRHLTLDIPILWQGRSENLELKITHDGGREGQEDPQGRRWQVRLAFEMEEMPPMTADLVLEGERISVLWYGNRDTRDLLSPRLAELQQLLETIGLEVNTLAIREASAPDRHRPVSHKPLIDITT